VSSADIPRHVLDAADISAVTQLILTERESRDLGQWDRMRNCFHPDSLVRISWFTGTGYDFVTASIEMAQRKVLAKHRLGPVLVRLAAERAVASLSGIVDIPITLEGVEAQLSSHVRFLYRAERRAARWRIFGFDAIYLRDELTPSILGQSLPVTPADVSGFRRSYRMLSYVLTRQGYRVNPDLAGEDRPESAAALMAELYRWAGLES
jgi:hypothetical protein